MKEKTKTEALKFINEGGECKRRYGWGWKGAPAHTISKEEALKLFPEYDFGEGYKVLYWEENDNVLVFNEYSLSDMF